MIKKGSITVFLALLLSLMLALLSAGLRSVRMASARVQILNSVDIGLCSLFGEFDPLLLDQYDIFALNAGEYGYGGLYGEFEKYTLPVLKQNRGGLTLTSGGISGYRLLTDENGEVFYQQIVSCMKETIGIRGAQKVLQKYGSDVTETRNAWNSGNELESGDRISSYEETIDDASTRSKEAERSSSGNQQPLQTDGKNPVPTIKKIRKRDLLSLVIPSGISVSDGSIKKTQLLSGRTQDTGYGILDEIKEDSSRISQILYQSYLLDKLGNFSSPSSGELQYQIEYLLSGKKSDRENLKSVAIRLLLIREGINAAFLYADPVHRAQAAALASAIAAGFLIPPAVGVIEGAIILCWAYGESLLDVRELFDGGRVPLQKTETTWQLSLENLPYLLQNLDSLRKSDENGLAYEDYLRIFLMTLSKERQIRRGMDMIELSVRAEDGKEAFRLDQCVMAMEFSVKVDVDHYREYEITRDFSYG